MQIGFLVFPDVQQLDLTGPFDVFASIPETTVHLIWKDTAPVTSSTGLSLIPTAAFGAHPPLDVLCIPGGPGVNALLGDEEVLGFVRDVAPGCRFVTSVCTGSLVLGVAGLLTARRATSHWAALDLLGDLGAIPTEGRVVWDGSVVTAGGVTSGIDFGLEIVARLHGPDVAEAVQLALEYDPAPPFSSGTPHTARPEILAACRARLSATRRERETIIASIRDSRM